VDGEESAAATPADGRKPVVRAAIFATVCLALLTASLLLPIRQWWSMDRLVAWASRLGWRAPACILAAGATAPLFFLPRWPIAMVSGLLYGVARGTILANVASTLGALAQYALARSMLAPWFRRILERRRSAWFDIPTDHAFLGLFLLRAFPLSNFVATNIVAGTLRIRLRIYLAASFLGMIPSSLMYAAWGKLMKEPSPTWYAIAGAMLSVTIVGTWWAQRRFGAAQRAASASRGRAGT